MLAIPFPDVFTQYLKRCHPSEVLLEDSTRFYTAVAPLGLLWVKLVLCFQVSPCRCEFATCRHLSLQANRRQRPTHTVEGDILYLVVVGAIWRSRGVGETIRVLFTACACTGDQRSVDNPELTGFPRTS